MDQDFLKKEEEYRNENKLLEMRTKEILQKLGDMKKMQEFQLQDFKPEMTRIEPKDLNLPKSVDEMGTKGMIQFYKSKLKATQEDLSSAQNELKKKTEEVKKLQKNLQTLSEEKEKWFLQCNIEKNNNAKLEKQIAVFSSKVQLKESENTTLKKEVEQLKLDLTKTSNELTTSENRLKRALQDTEKLKGSLKNLSQEQKETKESYQSQLKELNATVKQIQKHKNELLQGYKKQIQLIDNLKRQKVHVESCKVLELAESEFLKLLDWKIE